MSVPPEGVGPRGTLPLGFCPVGASPYAPRHAAPECRATVLDARALRQAPELPDLECFPGLDSEQESEPEPAAVEPYRSAQGWGDVAQAPRAPALRAPVRLREHSSAPSVAPLASSRSCGGVAAGVLLTTFGAVAIVALAMPLRARHQRELPALRQEPELHAVQTSPAPSTREPAPPAVVTPGPASAPTSTAHAVSTARARQHVVPRRDAPAPVPARTSDIVDPWR